MAFDQTAIPLLYDQLVSRAQALAAFEQVIPHEPKAAPVSLPALAVWWQSLGPARGLSGLDATSPRCEFRARAYLSYRGKDEDVVEREMLVLASQVIGALSAAYTLGGEVMAVDLLGGWGEPLSAQGGYLIHDEQQFRVAEIVIPVVVDDGWIQEA